MITDDLMNFTWIHMVVTAGLIYYHCFITEFMNEVSSTFAYYMTFVLKYLQMFTFAGVVVLSIFYIIMCITALLQKKQVTPFLPRGNEPMVTIQIPTCNELAALNCARCCLAFDYPRDKMQIIIGDDSSNTSVSKKIDEFVAQYSDVMTVTRRGKNIGFKPGNLNHMLKSSIGKYIVIFDSDHLPPSDFLRKMLYPFYSDPFVSAAQARWRIININQNMYSILGGAVSSITHYVADPFLKSIGANCFIGGSAEVIKKVDLDAVGGWRHGTLTEDIECSLDLIEHKKRLVYIEDAIVDCEAPYTYKDLCKQQKRWAFGNVTAFKRHFKSIILSKSVSFKDKLSFLIFVSGYLYPALLLFLLCTTILLLIINTRSLSLSMISSFLSSFFWSVLFTSGSLISCVIILFISQQKRSIPKLIFGTFTVGILLLIHVNIGIFKALFKGKMEWYILKKKGNETAIRPINPS